MKKIRVLHVLSDTNVGGAGKLLLNLSTCIDKNKFEFIFPSSSVALKYKLNLNFVEKTRKNQDYREKSDGSPPTRSISASFFQR